jgi:hypothetical protein
MAEVVEGKTIIVTVMFAGAVIAAVPNIGKPYPPPTVWWTHPGHANPEVPSSDITDEDLGRSPGRDNRLIWDGSGEPPPAIEVQPKLPYVPSDPRQPYGLIT